MPNWCQNKLTVTHDSRDMLDAFCKAYNENKTCEGYLPQPEDIGDDWYDWRIEKWGTKWDFGYNGGPKATIDSEGRVSISFDTAWSPPTGLYDELIRLGFDVNAMYFEGGVQFFGFYSQGANNCNSFHGVEGINDEIVEAFGLEAWIEDVKHSSPSA